MANGALQAPEQEGAEMKFVKKKNTLYYFQNQISWTRLLPKIKCVLCRVDFIAESAKNQASDHHKGNQFVGPALQKHNGRRSLSANSDQEKITR